MVRKFLSCLSVAMVMSGAATVVHAQYLSSSLPPAPESPCQSGLRRVGLLQGHTCTEPGRDKSYYVPGSTPVYPADLAKHGVGGMVMLQMRVSATGLVTNIHISRTSGYPELDAAALAAVSHWKYSPGTVDGVPVDTDGFAFVNFRPK